MRKIKILGAGLSGLAAAINLAKAGIEVEVFEKNSDCGMRFHGDMQGLENWSDKEDVLDSLSKMHIDVNFNCTPFRKVIFANCEQEQEFSFDKPVFYLIERGSFEGSIDYGVKQQALDAGVSIYFDQDKKPDDVDIVATGPRFNHIAIADKGIIFKTDLSDMAIALISDKAAFKGYSYLLVANSIACLCSCTFDKIEKLNDNFEFTKKYFCNKYNLKIENEKAVGGVGYFSINNIYKDETNIFVGEAAGIQDFLAGFGMRTAITSGYLAAKSIIENLDYEKLAEEKFSDYIKAGVVNRYIWEHTQIDNYFTVLNKLNGPIKGTDVLRSMYNLNLAGKIEYPIALQYIKKQYPEVL